MITDSGVAAFASAVERLAGRPGLARSRIGVQVRDLRTDAVVYSRLGAELFAGASTAKLLTCGAAFAALGPEFRFETKVFRAGENLVLAASGDPNLSGRIGEDGALKFADVDHALAGHYAGTAALPGDSRDIFRNVARQIASQNIARVRGDVLVDTSLFAEGETEGGTHAVISPVAVNDNLIDVTVIGAPAAGEPARICLQPQSRYARFINETITAPGSETGNTIELAAAPVENGVRAVKVRGAIAPDGVAHLAYRVPEPSLFARAMLIDALEEIGIAVDGKSMPESADRSIVAVHQSPPLREAVKVVLKVSQNLHAEMLMRAVRARGDGFLPFPSDGAFLGDGCGAKAHFTPDFMCGFLTSARKASWGEDLLRALPILGCDGTLRDIQRDTRAASARAVRAKTGTLSYSNVLESGALMESKALAGYVTTAGGSELAFTVFFSNVPFADEREPESIGNLVASVAVAAYDAL